MMIGETIYPSRLSIFASGSLYSAGSMPGTPTKLTPASGIYAEGFQVGVPNVQGQELNYVLNALTQQAIISRDQMLLPQTICLASEVTHKMHDPGFGNPLRPFYVAAPNTSSQKIVDISPYYYAYCERVSAGGLMKLMLFKCAPSPNYSTELTTNLTHYNGGYGTTENLFYDHYLKRIYLINALGARRYSWDLSGQTTLHSTFVAEGVTTNVDRFCAANGVLIKAVRTAADLRVYQSSDSGATVNNTVILSNVTTTTEGAGENTSPRMPIALDWIPSTPTQAGLFKLVTRDGGVYTSTNGINWVNQKPHGTFKPLTPGTSGGKIGMLSSAAFVGDTIVAMLPNSEDGSQILPVIVVTNDDFFTFRIYPTKYTHVRAMGQRLHYAHMPDSVGWPTNVTGDYSYLPVLTQDGYSLQAFSQRLVKLPNMVQAIADIPTPATSWP